MGEEKYYHTNLETGKLNIHSSKDYYEGLSGEQKKIFSKYCLWSRKQGIWISKGKAENCYDLKKRLDNLGFVRREATGERVSFEEQVNKEKERAELRRQASENHAAKAEQKAEELSISGSKMLEIIPPGQPILTDHYSANRDRNYRDRIDSKFRRSNQESEKAKQYHEKADNAKYTAEGRKFKNEHYLSRRIAESERSIRVSERKISGKYNPGSPIVPISDQLKAFYEKCIAEHKEKLDFYYKCMREIKPDWQPAQKRSRKKGKGI